jgi:hypothetical protein
VPNTRALPRPVGRLAAAGLAVALVASSLALGVSAAQAAPGAPSITSPADGFETVDTTIVVSGELADSLDQVVEVVARIDGAYSAGCSTLVAYFDTTFSCSLTVAAAGEYEVTATAVDAADPDQVPSPVSNTVTVRVGTSDPVEITNYTSFSNEWGDRTVTIAGTGPRLGSVDIEVVHYPPGEGEQTDPFCTDPAVDLSGEWSCTGTSPSWGYVYFVAYGTTIDGQETTPGSYDDEIGGDVIPPAPTTTIGLGPASITYSAQGAADNFLIMRLYEAELNGEGSSFTQRDTCTSAGQPPTISCTFSGLTPGVWNLYTNQDYAESYFANVDEFVMIPTAPTGFAATVLEDRSVRFSGQGTPGYRAIVRDSAQNTVCSVFVAANGQWRCTATPPAGTANYRSVQQSVGFDSNDFEVSSDRSFDGFSALTSAISVTVPPASPRPAPQNPAVVAAPLPWVLEGYDGSPLTPGQQLTLTASGLPDGTEIVVEIRSTPQVLGTAVVGDAGTFSLDVVVPTDLEPGDHTLVAIATPPGGVASPVSIPVVVVAAPEADLVKETVDSIAPEKSDAAGAGSGGSAGGAGDRSNPAAPSAITDSIPTLQRIVSDPWVVLASGGLALAILLLVAFPAELLNSTLSSNTSRLGRWFVAIERKTEQVTEWFTRVSRTRALAAAVLVALTAVIFGFVDPQYGFDPVSLRMTVSLAIGLFLITYVSAWISGSIARRAWGVTTQISLQPVALLFAVVGVVVARLLEFSPGFLIGLVIGLDLLSRVDAAVRARVVVLSTAVVASIAVVAWFAFSALVAVSSGTPGWVELLISDALVATTAEGLTAALASLLPLGFLAGHEVFRHSKPLWAGTFIAVGALFALIVLPTAAGETTDVADVGFWMLVMVIFAVVTLSLWAVLQFTGRRDGDDEGSGSAVEQPVAGTAR